MTDGSRQTEHRHGLAVSAGGPRRRGWRHGDAGVPRHLRSACPGDERDGALVARCRAAEDDAWVELVRRLARYVRAIAASYGRDAADTTHLTGSSHVIRVTA